MTNQCTQIDPGSSCQLGINFNPSTTGARDTTLVITSNNSTSPDVIQITGTGK